MSTTLMQAPMLTLPARCSPAICWSLRDTWSRAPA